MASKRKVAVAAVLSASTLLFGCQGNSAADHLTADQRAAIIQKCEFINGSNSDAADSSDCRADQVDKLDVERSDDRQAVRIVSAEAASKIIHTGVTLIEDKIRERTGL